MNCLEQKLSNRCSTGGTVALPVCVDFCELFYGNCWPCSILNKKSEVNFTGADTECFHLLLIECTELCYCEIYIGDSHMNWTAVNSLLTLGCVKLCQFDRCIFSYCFWPLQFYLTFQYIENGLVVDASKKTIAFKYLDSSGYPSVENWVWEDV